MNMNDKNTLSYKGYTGSIEVSLEDNCLHGRILFINDLISYEGNDVAALKKDFEEALDDYLAHCEQTGVPANKPLSGSFNIRVGEERHKKLAIEAINKRLSINELVIRALDSHFKRTEGIHNHYHQNQNTILIAVTDQNPIYIPPSENRGKYASQPIQ
jgi:predicted HicB family RNase H-like nuclease